MTYDELINILDAGVTNFPEDFQRYRGTIRAVVELHKPSRCNQDCCDVCVHCFELEGERADIYPCPTIQAIEKELSNG